MRPRTLLLILFLSGLTFLSTRAAASPLPPQLPGFTVAGSCFKQFPSYDAWLDNMRERNGWFKTWLLSWRYNESAFNDMVNGVNCWVGTYKSVDGPLVQGFIVTPQHKMPDTSALPVVIYNRGGNQQFGSITLGQLMDFIAPLSQRGYIVAASQYRGGNPRLAGQDEFGGKDVEDVLRLRDIVIQHPEADASQQYMLGVSRGAMNTFMALRQQSHRNAFKAVAVIGGLVDLTGMIAFRPEMERVYKALIPDYATQKAAQLYQRSASAWPEKLPADTAILQLHGEDDTRVDVTSAQLFSQRISPYIHSHQLHIYAGENHMIRGAREQVIDEIDAWFKQHH